MKLVGIFFRLFGFFTAAAAGLLMLALAILSWDSTYGLGSWEKKTAVVVSSAVSKMKHVKGASYCPDIFVSYDFSGNHHQSKLQMKDLPCSPLAVSPTRLVAEYPVGKIIEILVDPKNPAQVKANDYSRSLMFYIFLVLGGVLILLAFKVLFASANKQASGTRSKRRAPYLHVRCHMSNRAAHILGWVTATFSLAVGLLGAAPFTPAIFFVAFLLPAAAFAAWRGAVVAGILSLLLCVLAFAISPLPMAQLIEWPLAVAWLGLCLAAVVLGAVHGARARNNHAA